MYANFKFESLPLTLIQLDTRNPRIVTQAPLPSQEAILEYLFRHEGLLEFAQKIASDIMAIPTKCPVLPTKTTKTSPIAARAITAASKRKR